MRLNAVEKAAMNNPVRRALQRLGVAAVDAVDLDEDMVARARRRLAGIAGVGRIVTGDATDPGAALGAEDGSYDLVLDFGTFHHPARLAGTSRPTNSPARWRAWACGRSAPPARCSVTLSSASPSGPDPPGSEAAANSG